MKKVLMIGGVLLAAMIGVLVIWGFLDLGQESKLRKEIDAVMNLDVTKDTIDMTIYSKGDYGVIEKTIKELLNEYSSAAKKANSILESPTQEYLLSIENFEKDGPYFTETKQYLVSAKEALNNNYNKMAELIKEETVLKRIEDKNLDEEYVALYRELMLGDSVQQDLESSIKDIEATQKMTNEYINLELKIFSLLADNADIWYVENGELLIEDDEILTRFNALVDQVNSLHTEES